jgi:hypothetical protein
MRLCSFRALFFALFPVLTACFFSGPASAAERQTLTGIVSDSMCATQHMEPDAASCTRTCVSHGAKYNLVVGEKVYALNTTDKSLLNTLNQEAGSKVTVTGTVNGVGVDVSSVSPAK